MVQSIAGRERKSECPSVMEDVHIPMPGAAHSGELTVPELASGLVLFVHGSGSSRLSPRNRFVARALNESGLATLLFDLLTPAEEALDRASGRLRFDIARLAERLGFAAEWVAGHEAVRRLPIGFFGASTGGGAALVAAAARPRVVRTVVSRGGRPDLAGSALREVQAATLLVVGEADEVVVGLNRAAMAAMRCPVKLELIPGAGHLFEEPGALEQVARLAADWFTRFLPAGSMTGGSGGVRLE
jgi:dienelactone hydrolase